MHRRTLALLLILASGLAVAAMLAQRVPRPDTGRCGGQRFAIETAPGGLSPYITLEANGQAGAFLLDYGASFSTVSADRFPAWGPGATITARFSLPTFSTARFELARYWAQRAPSGGQLGVVGTDFLSLLTADFSFSPGAKTVLLGEASCSADDLRRRGLQPVRQTGFFSSDPGRLSDGHLNIPILYLRIGGVTTWAQIDTGYDDTELRPSIDINEPLYQRLLAAGVRLEPRGTVSVSTCSGTEPRSAYTVANVQVETETGSVIAKLGPVALIRKPSNGCGGVAGLASPAAQASASIVAALEVIVFDPRAETVWIKKQD